MTIDFGSALFKLSAGFAAQELADDKQTILVFVDTENPILAADLVAAIEKAEPGGLRMALVAGTLNEILNGLEDEEKAALPTGASDLIDWAVAKLTAIAKG